MCQCERGDDPSVAQALHLMNSPEITRKVQHPLGFARTVAESGVPCEKMIDSLCLATLTRFPTDEERRVMAQAFKNGTGEDREATEDVLWTLLNTREFMYNH